MMINWVYGPEPGWSGIMKNCESITTQHVFVTLSRVLPQTIQSDQHFIMLFVMEINTP